MADRHLHEYGFDFKMSPTVKEFQEFKEDLGLAMMQEGVLVEVKVEATRLFKINAKLLST
jgi:hypothetical protein